MVITSQNKDLCIQEFIDHLEMSPFLKKVDSSKIGHFFSRHFLNDEEKLCYIFSKYCLYDLGLDDVEISFSRDRKNRYGSIYKNHVEINSKYLKSDLPLALNTIAHEIRHKYQALQKNYKKLDFYTQNYFPIYNFSNQIYSIIYDENGDAYTPTIWQLKGTDCRVISAQKIKGKWYYQIGSVKGATQWIKAVNAYVVDGPTLIKDPSYKEPTPDVDVADTIVTLRVGAPTYNSKGEVISNNSFNAGQSLRVSKLVWIYLPSENKSVKFYKIASDSKSYIRVDDVDLISGKNLTAVNTSEDAYENGVIATSSDKSELASLINNASTVKNSDS